MIDQLLRELRAEAATREIMATKEPDAIDRSGHEHVARLLRDAVAALAAAPELIDLLRRMHERLTDGRTVPEWMSGWDEEIEAAIAKAGGV